MAVDTALSHHQVKDLVGDGARGTCPVGSGSSQYLRTPWEHLRPKGAGGTQLPCPGMEVPWLRSKKGLVVPESDGILPIPPPFF